MIKPLILVGSGGFSREALEVVHAVNAQEETWKVLGFTDDDPAKHGTTVGGAPVLGSSDHVVDAFPDAFFVLGPASPANYFIKRRLEAKLGIDEDRYATLIHPAASIGKSVVIESGTVILAGVVATADAYIGSHCAIMPNAVIAHDVRIESYSSVAANAAFAGAVTIEEETFIGAGALINGGLRVGHGSLVGLGSVVLSDIAPMEVWAGVPAKKLRNVTVPASNA